jgi:hypothetical protein
MCEYCDDNRCQHVLKHIVIDMVWRELKKSYQNLDLIKYDNGFSVMKDDREILTVQVCNSGNQVKVWRTVPRYETSPKKISAADPEFVSKVIGVLTQ